MSLSISTNEAVRFYLAAAGNDSQATEASFAKRTKALQSQIADLKAKQQKETEEQLKAFGLGQIAPILGLLGGKGGDLFSGLLGDDDEYKTKLAALEKERDFNAFMIVGGDDRKGFVAAANTDGVAGLSLTEFINNVVNKSTETSSVGKLTLDDFKAIKATATDNVEIGGKTEAGKERKERIDTLAGSSDSKKPNILKLLLPSLLTGRPPDFSTILTALVGDDEDSPLAKILPFLSLMMPQPQPAAPAAGGSNPLLAALLSKL